MTCANYENTYWSGEGKHEDLKKKVQPLVPAVGKIPDAANNPALEKFRIASSCYHDLYNNGLCNRKVEFRKVFGFASGHEYGDELTQKLIDRTEAKMDEIILAAHREQFDAVHMAHCYQGEYPVCKYGQDDTCPAKKSTIARLPNYAREAFSDREIVNILHALRNYADDLRANGRKTELGCNHFEDPNDPMDANEIDALCDFIAG